MTTITVYDKVNNLEEELKQLVAEHFRIENMFINCSDDTEDPSLSALRSRELDLLDLRGLNRFHNLKDVNTKKLAINIEHLMAGLVIVQPDHLKWEYPIPFAPDLIEINLHERSTDEYHTDTVVPVCYDEREEILRLHKDLKERNPKAVIMLIWEERQDCGEDQGSDQEESCYDSENEQAGHVREHKIGSDTIWYNRYYA